MKPTTQRPIRRGVLLGACVLLGVAASDIGCTLGAEEEPVEPIAEVGPTTPPDTSAPGDEGTVAPGPDANTPDTAEATPEIVEDAGSPPECTPETDWKCDDWESCTDDACVDGACVHTELPGCCSEDAHCDDGIPCTYDECNLVKSECMHPFESNTCCITTADCGGGSACSTTLCAGHQCAYPVTSAEGSCACGNKLDCDDGNLCTSETCEEGHCLYSLGGGDGCCTSNEGCNDGDDSTVDQCQQGLCWHGAATCASDEDCEGPGTCSTGTCQDGACAYPEGCCALDTDCEDGAPVTTDRCVGSVCVHDFGAEVPCAADQDCAPQNTCAAGTCVPGAGLCSWSGSELDDGTCCAQDGDCFPSAECLVSSCVEMTCVQETAEGSATFWSATWGDGTLDGWTETGDGKDAKWQITDAQAISSPYSLYYGRLPELDYDVGKTTGSVLSPVITPPADASGLELRFWRSANIEPIVSSDKLWLELVTDGDIQILWDKNDNLGPGLGWKLEVIDLQNLVSGPFQLRFVFDSVDDINNAGLGVFVDDMELLQECGSGG